MRQAECDELCFVHPFMSNTSQQVIEEMAREAAEARREVAVLYSGIMLSPLAKQCGSRELEMNFYECLMQYVINYLSSANVFHECKFSGSARWCRLLVLSTGACCLAAAARDFRLSHIHTVFRLELWFHRGVRTQEAHHLEERQC
jgi:hypothetical protein